MPKQLVELKIVVETDIPILKLKRLNSYKHILLCDNGYYIPRKVGAKRYTSKKEREACQKKNCQYL